MPTSDATSSTQPARGSVLDSVTTLEGVFKSVERFGLPLVMLGIILWWAKNDIVQPLLQAHFQVVEQIVRGQRDHSDKLENIGEKLDELIKVSK